MRYKKEIIALLLSVIGPLFVYLFSLVIDFTSGLLRGVAYNPRAYEVLDVLSFVAIIIEVLSWFLGQLFLAYLLVKRQGGGKFFLLFAILYPFYFWGITFWMDPPTDTGVIVLLFVVIALPIYLGFSLLEWILIKKVLKVREKRKKKGLI